MVAVAQPQTVSQEAPPNITYIAIGSVMGCLVLMTVVVVAVVVNNRGTRKLHHTPTTMSVVPTKPSDFSATDNPSYSSRVLFAPTTARLPPPPPMLPPPPPYETLPPILTG